MCVFVCVAREKKGTQRKIEEGSYLCGSEHAEFPVIERILKMTLKISGRLTDGLKL